MDRLAGDVLQAAVAEVEADQDRTAAKGQPQYRMQLRYEMKKARSSSSGFFVICECA
jgi:hypothetical protein